MGCEANRRYEYTGCQLCIGHTIYGTLRGERAKGRMNCTGNENGVECDKGARGLVR